MHRVLKSPLLALAAAACALHSCGDSSAPPRQDLPDVVVVLVDQLRQDVAYREMERVMERAREGVVFAAMRSAAPWTYPSVISFLTGLYPQQHNADGHLFKNVLATFDRTLPLLPALLRRHGYATAGFVANPFLHTWNPFHAAFDSYRVDFVPSRGNLRGRGDEGWSPQTMFANTVNPAVLEHLARQPRQGPEFTYVHYIDVHGPYEGAPFAPDYVAATRSIDGRVMELYEAFLDRSRGNLIFVVTADHGQALGDDESVGQGEPWRKNKKSPHDFNLLVPFVILPSAVVAGPVQVAAPASQVDFVPTLLDWLGLPAAAELPGASLLAAIRGGAPPDAARPLYARMSAFGYRADCVVAGGRKHVRHFDPRSGALIGRSSFDLLADPREVAPLAGGFDGALFPAAAGSHGRQWPARFEEVSSELEENLRALGYLGDTEDN